MEDGIRRGVFFVWQIAGERLIDACNILWHLVCIVGCSGVWSFDGPATLRCLHDLER